MLFEVVLARFEAEGADPDVVFGFFVDAGPVDAVETDSLSFLFEAARFGPDSAVTSAGRGSDCCGVLDAGVDRDNVGRDVAALAATVVEVTMSDVTRNGVLKSDSIGCCGCISGVASSPCGS